MKFKTETGSNAGLNLKNILMTVNISEVKKQAPQIIKHDPFFNTCIELSKIFFGERSVLLRENSREVIINTTAINLRLLFSSNESKVWIDTCAIPDELINAEDIYYKFHRANVSYRIFDLETFADYLQIKKTEHEFVKATMF